MSARLPLVIASVLVLGLGLYLFVEVRESPARAGGSPPTDMKDKAADAHARRAPAALPAAPPEPVAAVEDPKPPPMVIDHEPSALPPPARPLSGLQTSSAGGDVAKLGPNAASNPKMESIMEEANKAFDRGDYDEARAIAGKVLAKVPGNTRMLRIMVTAACIDGDKATAQNYYNQLPAYDRGQMQTRCNRDHGITFDDPPSQ